MQTIVSEDSLEIKKNQIEHLKTIVSNNCERHYQLSCMNAIFTVVNYVGITLQNDIILRGRAYDPKEIFLNTDQLIYRKEKIAKGRFNEKDQSMFYASISEYGVLRELHKQVNGFLVITYFKRMPTKDPWFFIIGNIPEFPHNKTTPT